MLCNERGYAYVLAAAAISAQPGTVCQIESQLIHFIDAYTRLNRRPPAEWEMQRHFGVTPPSVHQMILALERAGFLRRQPGVPRSIEVLVPPEHLPILQAHIQPVKTSVPRY